MSTRGSMHTGTTTTNTPTWLRPVTTVVGATFLLVGILGFIPGITTNYGDMTFASHDSDAQLLGIFEVSVLHNVVHLLFGIVGLIAARKLNSAAQYLLVGGIIYLALWLYGLIIDQSSSANFVPVNTADNWLHFVLGVAMTLLGALGLRQLRESTGTTTGTTTGPGTVR